MAVAALLLVSCKKPVAENSPFAPADSSKSPVAEATPEPKHEYAPPGRYFLKERKSLTTRDGIIGVPPGTPLHKIERDKYQTDDGKSLKLAAREVTNDVTEARRLVRSDDADRTSLLASIAAAAPSVVQPSTQAPSPVSFQKRQLVVSANGREYVPGVNRQPTGLELSTELGATHTQVADGWLWQKSPDGSQWLPIKRVDKRYWRTPSPKLVR